MLGLAWPLARRDVLARYRGSLLGVAWALMTPLAMVAVYALVFQGVFQARWPGSAGGGVDFALRVFVGLTVFSGTVEVATRAVRLMADHANLVKRVVFPLEVLGVALVLQSAVHAALQTVVLVAGLLAVGAGPQPGWLLVPLVWAWILLLQLGLAWALAALGCYVRDLQHVLPPLFGGLLFLTPVFYSREAAPPALAALLAANPLTLPIETLRAAWFGDPLPGAPAALAATATLAGLGAALWLFRRLRPGFADLL